MTHLDNLQQIEKKLEEKIALHKTRIAESERDYNELIFGMARQISDLEDDLRKYREEDWNKRAYGD